MTLLQKIEKDRQDHHEHLRHETRRQLKDVLHERRPAPKVLVFGSLVKPGRFTESSDIDIALDCEPTGMSIYQLIAQLSERLGRRVDVVLLSETRFRDRIFREGEEWTLPG